MGQLDSSVDRCDLRFATRAGQKLRPALHQPPSALEQIRTGVGRPRLVPLHMGQCQINDFPGRITSLGRLAVEAGTKSIGYGSDTQLLEQVGQCRSRKRLSLKVRKHQTGATRSGTGPIQDFQRPSR